MKILNSLWCAGAMLVVARAFAQDAESGWYLSPMLSYMKVDSGRSEVKDGIGGMLLLGYRQESVSFEFWTHYLSADHDAWSYTKQGPSTPDPTDNETVTVVVPEGSVKFTGVGAGLRIAPFEGGALEGVFWLAGLGINRREDHPRLPQKGNSVFLDAGLGYAYPVRLWGHGSAIRTDLRYRYDIQKRAEKSDVEPPPPYDRYYEDLVLSLGLDFGLVTREVQATPAPVAAQVVPVNDADGDGVTDERDQCPDSPAGSAVDDAGCVPSPPPGAMTTPRSPTTIETAEFTEANDRE